MTLRITYSFEGNEGTFETEGASIVVGRPKPGLAVDLDLTPDTTVSRQHARVWCEGDVHLIEDLGSARGTYVNGVDIREIGRTTLRGGERIQIGSTFVTLHVEHSEGSDAFATAPAEQIVGSVGADAPSDASSAEMALLYELPLSLGAAPSVTEAASLAVGRVVEAMPGSVSGALLLLDKSGNLVLAAYVPEESEPTVSLTSAREAMERREALLWIRGPEPTMSQREHALVSGIYAPLMWQQRVIGVLSLSRSDPQPFTERDLRLAATAAHHAAMAITNQQMQEDLRRNAIVLERLLTNFSPQIRGRLVEKARHGRLRLGGEKSEVTVLYCDLRGFTRTTAMMDAEDVVELLNDYFSALVASLFRFDGTIDKFIGDAILAVFGSPEPDPAQFENAVHAAVMMQSEVKSLNECRSRDGAPVCEVGIGIHCGEVLHGFIGTLDRMEFTVIGDAVNRASRYCAGAAGSEIVISPELYGHVWRVVSAEKTKVSTKHEGDLDAYRVHGLKRKP